MSKNKKNIAEELLVKYLLGEASPAEQAEVQQWIAADSSNKKYFEHFELIWQQSKALEAKSTVNVDDAWARFRQRTEEQRPAARTIEMPQPARTGRMRAAAALVLLAGVAGLLYFFVSNRQPEMIALHSEGNAMTQTLPDGTVVTLNKNSTLSYPETFDGSSRPVKLEGEAFFDVTPDKSKPFTIAVNDVKVTVVGTTFNIKSSEAQTEVIVETGLVEVAKKEFGVKLSPNEKAVVLRNEDRPVKSASEDELYNYYRTKEFVCDDTPLWRLADVLSEVYGVQIEATARVRNMPLTTTFSNESLNGILSVISETFNIQVERNGNHIILK